MSNKKISTRSLNILQDKIKLKNLVQTFSLQKISEDLNVSRNTVKNYCVDHGIITRSKGRPVSLTLQERINNRNNSMKETIKNRKKNGFVMIIPHLDISELKLLETKKTKNINYEDIILSFIKKYKEDDIQSITFPIIRNKVKKPIAVKKTTKELINEESNKIGVSQGDFIGFLIRKYVN